MTWSPVAVTWSLRTHCDVRTLHKYFHHYRTFSISLNLHKESVDKAVSHTKQTDIESQVEPLLLFKT